jgi:3-deoxy-D-manno-octulosonic-acid transferase
VLYGLVAYLLAPLYCGVLLWRGVRERGYWQHLGERFGFGPARPPHGVWIHAASVGEVLASAALVRALRARAATLALTLTTTTPAGAARARALFRDQGVDVRHVPLDLPGAVRRFCARVQPRLGVILETELWPNLYRECARRGVPLVLASARLSPRSARRYARFGGLARRTLAAVSLIAAQSEADAERFGMIGASPARTRVLGNLKFDFALPPATLAEGAALRAHHAPARPVWIAASTHANEERAALAAHQLVRQSCPTALLVLVPRHPQRFAEVAALLEHSGVRFVRRSQAEVCTPDTEVLLVDTLGELLDFYAAADVAFVGGSLVPVGGHNLLEPAAIGTPIVTGPEHANSAEVFRQLTERGALELVHDAHELGAAVARLLESPATRERMVAAAREVVSANRGTLEKLLGLIEPLLSQAGPVGTSAATVHSADGVTK